MKKKVLILAPYPLGLAPSQRFRFEHFLKFFPNHGLEYDFQSFWSEKAWKFLYKQGHTFIKFIFLASGFLRKIKLISRVKRYDFILIHREATPIGPPVFEFLFAKLFRKRVIYDFDDAIWLSNTSKANKIIAGIKWHNKVKKICKWSWKISVGNDYLAKFASQFNASVTIFPTIVDTELHHNKLKIHGTTAKPVVGWTGTHSTSVYLKTIEKPLKKLKTEVDFDFLVISNEPPELELDNLVFVPWSKEDEIDQLSKMDIGVMPLEDSQWEKGKCGFKLIQYLSLAIPAVASPVGVNAQIIDHSVNGYIAENDDDWIRYLKLLIQNEGLRNEFGKTGRKKIEDQFSVSSSSGLFFSLFE